MHEYGLGLTCGTCQGSCVNLIVSMTAKGDVFFRGLCVKCNRAVECVTTVFALMGDFAQMDRNNAILNMKFPNANGSYNGNGGTNGSTH